MQSKIRRTIVGAVAVLCLGLPTAGASAGPRHHHPKPKHHGPTLEQRYEPYTGTVGGEGWPVYTSQFAVPACIVNAESHGLLHEHSHPWGSSGLYQLELSNWEHYKRHGWPEYPYEGTKLQQSIVATDVLRSQGIHAWTTAAGCGY